MEMNLIKIVNEVTDALPASTINEQAAQILYELNGAVEAFNLAGEGFSLTDYKAVNTTLFSASNGSSASSSYLLCNFSNYTFSITYVDWLMYRENYGAQFAFWLVANLDSDNTKVFFEPVITFVGNNMVLTYVIDGVYRLAGSLGANCIIRQAYPFLIWAQTQITPAYISGSLSVTAGGTALIASTFSNQSWGAFIKASLNATSAKAWGATATLYVSNNAPYLGTLPSAGIQSITAVPTVYNE